MPSRRMIDPAFWQSYTMAQLTRNQRYLFIGLFSNADDQGRLKGHPALVRSIVFPLDDISLDEIESDLAAIAATGSILIYEVEEHRYIQITGWWKYQSPQWAYPSQLPPPDNWDDRLRYRKGNEVLAVNWNGAGGFADALPKALGKDLGKAQGEHIVQYSDSNSVSIGTNGANAPPFNLDGWHKYIQAEKNRQAALMWMFKVLYPGRDPPDYGYIGRAAKNVGGAGRLATLLWASQAHHPDGDVLRYCMGMSKGGQRPSAVDQTLAAAREILEEEGEVGDFI